MLENVSYLSFYSKIIRLTLKGKTSTIFIILISWWCICVGRWENPAILILKKASHLDNLNQDSPSSHFPLTHHIPAPQEPGSPRGKGSQAEASFFCRKN